MPFEPIAAGASGHGLTDRDPIHPSGLSHCARRDQNTLPTSSGRYAATGGRGDTPGLLEVVRCRRPGPLWLLLAAQDRSAGSTAIGTLSRSHVRPQTPWASCQARPDLARAGSSHRGGQATLTLFDRQRTLNVANCCAPVSSISGRSTRNGQAPSRRDTVYGSDACVSRVSPRCPAVVRRVNIGAGGRRAARRRRRGSSRRTSSGWEPPPVGHRGDRVAGRVGGDQVVVGPVEPDPSQVIGRGGVQAPPEGELDRADGHVGGGDVGGGDVGVGVLVDERDRPAQRVEVVSGRGSPTGHPGARGWAGTAWSCDVADTLSGENLQCRGLSVRSRS